MPAMYLQTPFVWGGAETITIVAPGQNPVTFEEVAVHFTDEEWEWLDPDQKALHREVMEEICWMLYTLQTDDEQHGENNPGLSVEPFERIDHEAGKQRLQTLNRKEMSTAKKAKLKTDSGRSFQEAWTESFGMTECNGKALCILCSRSVVSRTSSVRRHFETNHKSVAELGKVERKEFLEGQLRKYHSQKLSFCNDLSKTNQLTADSFQISLCLAKHGKPLSDGDFIKMAMLAGSNSLFHDFPNKDKIMQRISEMPLLRNTVEDQVLRMASDVSQQLTADLQEAACYSMCLDESTDINNHAML